MIPQYRLFAILFISIFTGSILTAQDSGLEFYQVDTMLNENIAYLYFYRTRQVVGSGNGIGIQINDEEIERLKNGRRLIVEYNRLDQPIRIESYNRINCTTAHSKLEIIPEGGKIYYIDVNWDNVFDSERSNYFKIAGLGINFILQDEADGSVEFNMPVSFKSPQEPVKRIKIN